MTSVVPNHVSSTKDRILDAAERLFAKHGIDATSLRAITAGAEVNLAAVNYHFKSKDALARAVIARRIGPVMAKRIAMLDQFEASAGGAPVPLAQILVAFVVPVLELRETEGREFCPLMGRIYTEPTSFLELVYNDHLADVVTRFSIAFGRALPGLTRAEVAWRLHFAVGVLAHVMAGGDLIRYATNGLCDPSDTREVSRLMISFLEAGFNTPGLGSTEV